MLSNRPCRPVPVNTLGVTAMKFCRTSLNTLRHLVRALSETDPRLSQELSRIATDSAPMPASSTVMALSQLNLIGAEAGSNLSV